MKKKITIKEFVKNKNKNKFLFSAGPASLLEENILGLRPSFGRGDLDYEKLENRVLNRLKRLSGHRYISRMQGSGSLALEIVSLNFLYGKILIVNTGYYSDRLLALANKAKQNTKNIKKIKYFNWRKINDISEKFDFIWACYTETSAGLKIPIDELKKLSQRTKSKLVLDATGSIGLEEKHHYADVISYSSCKGLFGLTGASFVAFNINPANKVNSFYLDINNHLNKKMTGPYHAICSLDKVLEIHQNIKDSVIINKKKFLIRMNKWLTLDNQNQPLLCTHVRKKISKKNKKVVLYKPRVSLGGSIVCHLGEAHLKSDAKGLILNNLKII